MKKIPYIDYKAIPEFCTINEVCRLFEVSKRELQELCETYDVQPRRNEIGEYGFVSYDVRKLHNLAYHSGRTGGRIPGHDGATDGEGDRGLSPHLSSAGAPDDPGGRPLRRQGGQGVSHPPVRPGGVPGRKISPLFLDTYATSGYLTYTYS